MEAKDTVMSDKVRYNVWASKYKEIISRVENLMFLSDYKTYCVGYEIADVLVTKQAEISFKMGKGVVVEWLERAKKIKVPKYQLKEWGIDTSS